MTFCVNPCVGVYLCDWACICVYPRVNGHANPRFWEGFGGWKN